MSFPSLISQPASLADLRRRSGRLSTARVQSIPARTKSLAPPGVNEPSLPLGLDDRITLQRM
jgi:hypothetical protein